MIVCAGELIVDCFKENGKTVKAAGGAPFNVAAGISLLGGEARFYGAVGDDENGEFMLSEIAKLPFSKTQIDVIKGRNTTYSEVISENGERSFRFHRDGVDYLLSFHSATLLLDKEPSIIHLGSLCLPFSEGRQFVDDVYGYLSSHPNTRLSFDVNYRDSMFPEGEEGKRLFLDVIAHADIVKVTEEELAYLTGESDVVSGARRLSSPGQLLCVSLGSKGSFFHLDELEGFIPSLRPLVPVDTTGAGDSFLSYVLFALDGRELRSFRHEELFDLFERANACGALATQKKGALSSFPRLSEVEGYLSRG